MNVECPHCKVSIQVPVSNAGEKAICPYCTGGFLLPAQNPYTPDATISNVVQPEALPDYKIFTEKKILAGIMGILFGALGIHKFMLGLNSAKIMLTVTILGIVLGSCLIAPGLVIFAMAIVGMIEGFLYLSKSDQEFYQAYAVEKRQWF